MNKKRIDVTIYYPDRHIDTVIWVDKSAGWEEITDAIKQEALSMIEYEWHVAE